MPGITLASRTFDTDGQTLFARLSGDFNPIHLDPIAARRTQAGAVVVHGIHAILWALDKLVELGALTDEILSLKVQFTNFIYVGSKVDLKLLDREGKSIRAELVLGGLTTASLIVAFGTPKETNGIEFPGIALKTGAADQPANYVRVEQMAELGGWMDVVGPAKQVERYFPYAVSAIGAHRTTAIVLLSRLVGMICPGLHSLFAAFSVELVDSSSNPNRIGFQVSGTDERFRMIRMNVAGAGVCGSVQAFLRWPPIAQASLSDIMKIVTSTEFAGSTTLIIGGSRGLGALTAKVLAAGGGNVILSYATGRTDAEHLAEEIRSQIANGTCHAIQYDIHQDAATQLKTLGTDISHLYYFATGTIARQKEGLFVMSLFEEFIKMYVRGFYDCCRFLGERGSQTLTAFYPSSIFVESHPPAMTEYSMAKMAGEILCANMNRAGGRVQVIVSRLPRLLTDQTATVLPVESGDPLKVMLPVIRKVQFSGLSP
jgi:acyl dehydratase